MDVEDDVEMLKVWGLVFSIAFFTGNMAWFFIIFGIGSFINMIGIKSFRIYEAYLQHQEDKAKRNRRRIEP